MSSAVPLGFAVRLRQDLRRLLEFTADVASLLLANETLKNTSLQKQSPTSYHAMHGCTCRFLKKSETHVETLHCPVEVLSLEGVSSSCSPTASTIAHVNNILST